MSILALPADALAWLGRQGTKAVAVSVFLGVSLPPLAAAFKPFVPEAIFMLLVLAFLRVDPAALRGYLGRPLLLLLATAWIMVAAPAVAGALFVAFGLHETSPDLFLALVLQASAAPIMSAPAFAALMGLDAALALATLITCIVATPLTTPVFTYLFAGDAIAIAPLALAGRLFLFLAGSAALAAAIRRVAGTRWVVRQRERIDGLSVITLFVFAVAVMDGVAVMLWNRPLFVVGLTALAFAMSLGTMVVTIAVFAIAGRGQALALGWSAANRNMGLMLAVTGGALPDLAWLYFGLAQFPIYLLPLMLQRLARRLAPPAGQ